MLFRGEAYMASSNPASTPVTVRSARPEEAADVARILQEAFRDDPVINWFLRDDSGAEEARSDFFRGNVEDYFGNARRVDLAVDGDGRAAGAALWTPPPGAQPSTWRERVGLWGLRGWTGLRRFPRFARLVLMTERRYPRAPHHYLFLVGVEADGQGKGVGSALLSAVLSECDAEGLPAYLESTNERNLPLYRRLGFEVTEEMRLGRSGPTLWLMWREPGG